MYGFDKELMLWQELHNYNREDSRKRMKRAKNVNLYTIAYQWNG